MSENKKLHSIPRTVEVSADTVTPLYRRNPRRVKAVIANEEASPRYDIRYAPSKSVNFSNLGFLLLGGKGNELTDDEAVPAQYAIGDGTNPCTITIIETFEEWEFDE